MAGSDFGLNILSKSKNCLTGASLQSLSKFQYVCECYRCWVKIGTY